MLGVAGGSDKSDRFYILVFSQQGINTSCTPNRFYILFMIPPLIFDLCVNIRMNEDQKSPRTLWQRSGVYGCAVKVVKLHG